MSSQKSSIAKKLKNLITQIDAYGHPIGLTYQDKRTFKSALGGGVTVLARLGILVFLIIEIIGVINKQSILKTTSLTRNLTIDETEYSFDQSNYDIAIRLNYLLELYKGIQVNEVLHQYAFVQVSQISFEFQKIDGELTWVMLENPFKLVKCDSTRFQGEKVITQILGIQSDFVCPENFRFVLKGNFQSPTMKFLRIDLKRCDQNLLDKSHPGEKCAIDEEP
eukprot:403331978